MNDSESWAQGFRCYEQLKVVVDIKYSGLWMTWATSSCEVKALDSMNSLGLWIIRITQDPMSTNL